MEVEHGLYQETIRRPLEQHSQRLKGLGKGGSRDGGNSWSISGCVLDVETAGCDGPTSVTVPPMLEEASPTTSNPHLVGKQHMEVC